MSPLSSILTQTRAAGLTTAAAITLMLTAYVGSAQAGESAERPASAPASAASTAPHPAAHAPHWAYQGAEDAAHWAELDPAFATCRLGQHQSPIDIDTRRVVQAGPHAHPIAFHYTASAGEVVNNGHTIQVNLSAAGALSIDGVSYTLAQFHFHTPSEEKIDGLTYPLVAHLVHRNSQGQLAVVAVLFQIGQENAALKPVFAHLPAHEGGTEGLGAPIDLSALLPADRAYYSFTGSLTTPPCSEEVRWHVLRSPVTLSRAQWSAFTALYSMNARPVQPLNDRQVTLVP